MAKILKISLDFAYVKGPKSLRQRTRPDPPPPYGGPLGPLIQWIKDFSCPMEIPREHFSTSFLQNTRSDICRVSVQATAQGSDF